MVIGACIGGAVVVIRALTPAGSHVQLAALVLAALVLALVHLAVRQSVRYTPPAPATRRRSVRVQQSELFAREADQRWTGLAETPPAETPGESQPRS